MTTELGTGSEVAGAGLVEEEDSDTSSGDEGGGVVRPDVGSVLVSPGSSTFLTAAADRGKHGREVLDPIARKHPLEVLGEINSRWGFVVCQT